MNETRHRRHKISRSSFQFFLMLLAFAVGTFVGGRFSENQRKVGSLENFSKDRLPASVEEGSLNDVVELVKKQQIEIQELRAKVEELSSRH